MACINPTLWNTSLTYPTNLPGSRQKCVGHSCPTHWFQHEFRTEMPGVGVFGTKRLLGHTPHGSWSGGLEAAHQAAEQFGFWASCREGNAHPRRGFTDPCGDFDQAHLQGFEFCGGEWLQLGDTATDFQHQR